MTAGGGEKQPERESGMCARRGNVHNLFLCVLRQGWNELSMPTVWNVWVRLSVYRPFVE